MTNTLEVGAEAPQFDLPRNGGGNISLAEFKGKSVILYFYPKDDTPGCTTEAIEFTAEKAKFTRAGAVVIGMSKDSASKHDKFVNKHDLKVALASDEEGTTLNEYGVWVEKTNYGRKYMGIERTTFLIDKTGKIIRIWRKVRVKGHVDDVLEATKAIAKN
ncbi:MAG TPA: thioredoxin-dependent thiol peroxidase [Sneathiellales bacterium]|nr:thioredoxin-dependent thiol peroxidase [Sneathiellales bacterium]